MEFGALIDNASIQPPASRLEKRYFGIDVPFMEYIGLKALLLEPDLCRTSLVWQPQLTNSRGDIHGGTIMAAMDFTLSAAARGHDPLALGVITIDMTSHFFEPARTALSLEARCTRRGRSIAFCDVEVKDENNVLVAGARGVFKLIQLNKNDR